MDGTCVFETTRTDGKLENAEFFLDFWPPVRLLPAGGCKFFGNRSVYHKSVVIINIVKSKFWNIEIETLTRLFF